jgi:hypothetical protein
MLIIHLEVEQLELKTSMENKNEVEIYLIYLRVILDRYHSIERKRTKINEEK